MNYGSFKSYLFIPETNLTLILGIGSFPINIKIAQLATWANSDTKQQGYKVTEVNKMIATMLTGWDLSNTSNIIKPKSMSDNYIELVLSCDSGFCVKKKMQFPHIIEWDGEQRFNYNEAYKKFSLDNWIKADDFATPDITLAMIPIDEITIKSGQAGSQPTTDNSGKFTLLYRNLPVGVNRIRVVFHIKTKTEPIEFDLEVKDGKFYASSEGLKNTNVLIKNTKELYQSNGAVHPFEEITPYDWQQLYVNSEVYFTDNKITHDLFFYPYV